ncbi:MULTISPECIES: tryptophanase leader peptide [Rodentibacter]
MFTLIPLTRSWFIIDPKLRFYFP